MYKRDLWGYKCDLLNANGDWNLKRSTHGLASGMYKKDLWGHKCNLLNPSGN
jgi:hypothetical protein